MKVLDSVKSELTVFGQCPEEIAFYKTFGCYLRIMEGQTKGIELIEVADLSSLAWYHQLVFLAKNQQRFVHPYVKRLVDGFRTAENLSLDDVLSVALAVYRSIEADHLYLTEVPVHSSYVVPYIDEFGHFNVEPSGAGIFCAPNGYRWHASMLAGGNFNNIALGLAPSELWSQPFEEYAAVSARLCAQVDAEQIFPEEFNGFMRHVGAVMRPASAVSQWIDEAQLELSEFKPNLLGKYLSKDGLKLAQYMRVDKKVIPYFKIQFLPNRQLDLSFYTLMSVVAGFSVLRSIQAENKTLFYVFDAGAQRDQSQLLTLLLGCLGNEHIKAKVDHWLSNPAAMLEPAVLHAMLKYIFLELVGQLEALARYQYLECSQDQLAGLLEAVLYAMVIRVSGPALKDTNQVEQLVNRLQVSINKIQMPVNDEMPELNLAHIMEELGDDVVEGAPLDLSVLGNEGDAEMNGIPAELGNLDLAMLADEDIDEPMSPGVLAGGGLFTPMTGSSQRHSPASESDAYGSSGHSVPQRSYP